MWKRVNRKDAEVAKGREGRLEKWLVGKTGAQSLNLSISQSLNPSVSVVQQMIQGEDFWPDRETYMDGEVKIAED